MAITNEGKRVKLLHTDDPYTLLKPGNMGTYEMVIRQPDGKHQHCIKWDNGSNLMLIEGVDRFCFVEDVTTYCEYCKEQTQHMVRGENDLKCRKCGSTRLHTIQGFDASLM